MIDFEWDLAMNSEDAAVLERLAGSEDIFIRDAVLGNPHAPAELLDRVARNTNLTNEKLTIACNPSVGRETLERLLRDRESIVVAYAASHMELTPAQIRRLKRREDGNVRLVAVLKNPVTPMDVLEWHLEYGGSFFKTLARDALDRRRRLEAEQGRN